MTTPHKTTPLLAGKGEETPHPDYTPPCVLVNISMAPSGGGWRCALAGGNPAFRKFGAYDEPVQGRRLRRILERQDKKTAKRGQK